MDYKKGDLTAETISNQKQNSNKSKNKKVNSRRGFIILDSNVDDSLAGWLIFYKNVIKFFNFFAIKLKLMIHQKQII